MTVRSFVDTNVLVYTDDQDAPAKREIALGLYARLRETATGVLSTQVLQEYFATATRKMEVTAETARRKVDIFGRLDLVVIDRAMILDAIDLHRLHQTSFWDALIVRAAQRSGCRVLYTEDLHAGWRVEGIEIVNPFEGAGEP